MAEILTVFYSLRGETIAPGMKVVNLEKGHTAAAAKYIQKAVGGDLFEIETRMLLRMENCEELRYNFDVELIGKQELMR